MDFIFPDFVFRLEVGNTLGKFYLLFLILSVYSSKGVGVFRHPSLNLVDFFSKLGTEAVSFLFHSQYNSFNAVIFLL